MTTKSDTIYFLYDIRNSAVRIGCTYEPFNRWLTLQMGNPTKLYFLGVMNGDIRKEGQLHKRFSYLCTQYSWYRLTDELRDFIVSNRDLSRTLDIRDKMEFEYGRRKDRMRTEQKPLIDYNYRLKHIKEGLCSWAHTTRTAPQRWQQPSKY